VSMQEPPEVDSSRAMRRLGIALLVLWLAVVVVYIVWQLVRGAHA